MDAEDRYASALWRALTLQERPAAADCLWVFGSTDIIVPAFAAALYFQLNPDVVVCSGGVAHENDDLNTGWQEPEGAVFKRVLEGFGVPESRILVENRATNTAQNFEYSAELLGSERLRHGSHVVVHKPYMTLRTKLTGAVVAPELKFQMCAPSVSYGDYCKLVMPRNRLVNIMVGDFQRISLYSKSGISAPHQFDDEAVDAFNHLVKMGFTRRLASTV